MTVVPTVAQTVGIRSPDRSRQGFYKLRHDKNGTVVPPQAPLVAYGDLTPLVAYGDLTPLVAYGDLTPLVAPRAAFA